MLFAGVFGCAFLLQFLVILFTVVAAVTHSNDQDIVDSFLYSQIRYNGAPKVIGQKYVETGECDGN